MLQFMGSQRAGHDLATDDNKISSMLKPLLVEFSVISIVFFFFNFTSMSPRKALSATT